MGTVGECVSECRTGATESNGNPLRPLPAPQRALRGGRRSGVAALALSLVPLAALLTAGVLRARQARAQTLASAPPAPRGVEIVENGGHPELRGDGSPFFIYSPPFSS